MTVVSLRTVPRPRARNARELAQQLDGLSPSVVPAPTVVVATAPYAPSGGLMVGSSQTPNQVAVGTQTFQMDQFGIGFAPGQRVRMAETAAPTTVWMEGAVLNYAEPILTVNVDLLALGVDTELYGPWSIAVTGMKGDKGDTGIQGPVGPVGPVPEAPNDTHYYARHQAAWKIFDTSPAFNGIPTTPTPPLADNSQQIANTNFIKLNSQPLSADLTSIAAAAAIGVMYYRSATGVWSPVTVTAGLSFSGGTLGVAGSGFAPLASPVLTGDPKAPTPPVGDNDTSIATTAYVLAAGFAPLASPVFTGNPTGPTPSLSDSSASLSTTGGVTAKLAAYAPVVSPTFTGTPNSTTPSPGDSSTRIATTAFVTGGLGTAIANLAPLASPVFTGTPRSETNPALADSSDAIATTSWVNAAVAALGGGIPDAPADSFNYGRLNSGWNNLDAIYAPRNNAQLIGDPQAPTPALGDNDQSIATTAFVQAAINAALATAMPTAFFGGIVKNNATAPNTSLDIAKWSGADSTGAIVFQVPAMTKTTAAWAAGTGAGGVGPGAAALATNQWFHMYAAIINGQPDYFFDDQLPPTHKPPNTTAWRRIMSFMMSSATAVAPFTMTPWNRLCLWTASKGEGAQITGSYGLKYVPKGLKIEVLMGYVAGNTQTAITGDLCSLDNSLSWTIWTMANGYNGGQFRIRTNTLGQITGNISTFPNSNATATNYGWYDPTEY